MNEAVKTFNNTVVPNALEITLVAVCQAFATLDLAVTIYGQGGYPAIETLTRELEGILCNLDVRDTMLQDECSRCALAWDDLDRAIMSGQECSGVAEKQLSRLSPAQHVFSEALQLFLDAAGWGQHST